jgi:hypothetical protein
MGSTEKSVDPRLELPAAAIGKVRPTTIPKKLDTLIAGVAAECWPHIALEPKPVVCIPGERGVEAV